MMDGMMEGGAMMWGMGLLWPRHHRSGARRGGADQVSAVGQAKGRAA